MAVDAEPARVSQVFASLPVKGPCPALQIGRYIYEIREFQTFGNGASYRGALAALRHDDLPHAARPQGAERELQLAEDEGLLEKTYFLYYRNQELLVIQRNKRVGGVGRLARYLSEIANETVSFDPILLPEPLKRLLNGDAQTRVLELTVARPRNPDLVPKGAWASQIMAVLSGSGGLRINLTIRGNARSQKDDERFLRKKQVLRAIEELTHVAEVKKAKMLIEEDGDEHPIDLITDRIASEIEVEVNGRYPNADGIFRGLQQAREEKRAFLNEVLGENGKQLR